MTCTMISLIFFASVTIVTTKLPGLVCEKRTMNVPGGESFNESHAACFDTNPLMNLRATLASA